MKKKIVLISGIVLIILFAAILCIVFLGDRSRTLDEITLAKNGGGPLYYEIDDYTIVDITFDCTEKDGDERKGTCYVRTNYYKKADYSASGKVFDRSDTKEYPCRYTDCTLTIGISDNYTYSVETHNKKEYVVFSKPFFGTESWYVNK